MLQSQLLLLCYCSSCYDFCDLYLITSRTSYQLSVKSKVLSLTSILAPADEIICKIQLLVIIISFMNRWDFSNFNYYSFVYIFAFKLILYNSFNARTHYLNNTNFEYDSIRFPHSSTHTQPRCLGLHFWVWFDSIFLSMLLSVSVSEMFCIFRRLLRFYRHARSDPLPLSVCRGLTPKRNSARNLLRCVAHRTANARTKQIRSLTGTVANQDKWFFLSTGN